MWYFIGFLILVIIILCISLYFSLTKNKSAKLEGIEEEISLKEEELAMVNADLHITKKQLMEADEAMEEYLDIVEKKLEETDNDFINRIKSRYRK